MRKKYSINTVNRGDPAYPPLLKEINDPPEQLYCLGNLPPRDSVKIAIVGTRKATIQGKIIAKGLSKKLSELGIIVVSGLAMGIDSAAHEGAVAAGGKTIAVLANGLDKIYPAQNENLAKEILKFEGAIISEYPEGTPSFPAQFLERNRIVSGLSAAVIVVEAPERSGSLATARLAAEQGREVFVVPGPVNHPNYAGSHKLIRDGARLITSTEDVLEDLGLKNQKFEIQNPKQILNSKIQNITDENQLVILETLQNAGKALILDEIVKLTKLEPQAVNSAIAFLTVEGIIKETERGYGLQ